MSPGKCIHIDGVTTSRAEDIRSEVELSVVLKETDQQLGDRHRVIVLQQRYIGGERAVPAIDRTLLFYKISSLTDSVTSATFALAISMLLLSQINSAIHTKTTDY